MSLNRKLAFAIALAVLVAGAFAALLLSPRRDNGGGSGAGVRPPGPDGQQAADGGSRDAPVVSAGMAELSLRLPDTVRFLLATDDVGGLLRDLEGGQFGKALAAPSVAKFIEALRAEPRGPMPDVLQSLELVRRLAPDAAGPMALLLWERADDGGPVLGMLAKLRPDASISAMKTVAGVMAPVGIAARTINGRSQETLMSLTKEGDDGLTFGSCGEWLAVCDSIGGCRILLALAAEPRPSAPERLGAGLTAVGSGRLFGFCEASSLVPEVVCGLLGVKSAEWIALSAAPAADGAWVERLILSGEVVGNGLGPAAGAADARARPLLAALPDSAIMAVSLDVADGAAFWKRLRSAGWPKDVELLARACGAGLVRATGLDFTKDVAPAVRGEVTVGWLLPRQGIYPQPLIGIGLVPDSADKISLEADSVLELPYFGGGEAKQDLYRGTTFHWLSGQEAVNPYAPSPAYCFLKERLLAAATSAHLKELLAAESDGAGGARRHWLTPAETERLSSGQLSVRVALDRCMPYIYGLLRTVGAADVLGEAPAAALPMPEDLSDCMKTLEIAAFRDKAGVRVETRAPLPAAALAGLWLLLAG